MTFKMYRLKNNAAVLLMTVSALGAGLIPASSAAARSAPNDPDGKADSSLLNLASHPKLTPDQLTAKVTKDREKGRRSSDDRALR